MKDITHSKIKCQNITNNKCTFAAELKHNGYVLTEGKQLKEFKLQFGHLINKTTKTTSLGLFNFRLFHNHARLLKESDNARLLHSKVLNIKQV